MFWTNKVIELVILLLGLGFVRAIIRRVIPGATDFRVDCIYFVLFVIAVTVSWIDYRADEDSKELLENALQESQNEYQVISEVIEPLKLQNNLPMLVHKAISQGDREAFEEIIRIAKMAQENTVLKRSAFAEVENVTREMYLSYLVRINPLMGRPDSGLSYTFREVPTAELILSLSDLDSEVRARAAGILGARPEKGVPDRLLQVARADKHLRVASYALISFGCITMRIKSRAALLQDDRNLTQLTEMFDIDKLAQWWKEHLAEVNGRLADMK